MSVRLDITADALQADGFRPLHAGDDYDMEFSVKRAGVVQSLVGALLWLTVKDDSIATDAQAKLQLDSDSGGLTVTDAAGGVFVAEFRTPATDDLEGLWEYDIQIKLASGTVITWARGKIEFLENITRTTS